MNVKVFNVKEWFVDTIIYNVICKKMLCQRIFLLKGKFRENRTKKKKAIFDVAAKFEADSFNGAISCEPYLKQDLFDCVNQV